MLKRSRELVLILVAVSSWAHAADEPSLRIEGDVDKPVVLTATDLAGLHRHVVKADDHGTSGEFEGVYLADVLARAGVPLGEQVRGAAVATTIIAGAPDGYRATYALPEIDPSFSDRVVLLALKRDGKPLDEREGPFRIIIPDEKRQGRWIREVNTLTVRREASPRAEPSR